MNPHPPLRPPPFQLLGAIKHVDSLVVEFWHTFFVGMRDVLLQPLLLDSGRLRMQRMNNLMLRIFSKVPRDVRKVIGLDWIGKGFDWTRKGFD